MYNQWVGYGSHEENDWVITEVYPKNSLALLVPVMQIRTQKWLVRMNKVAHHFYRKSIISDIKSRAEQRASWLARAAVEKVYQIVQRHETSAVHIEKIIVRQKKQIKTYSLHVFLFLFIIFVV